MLYAKQLTVGLSMAWTILAVAPAGAETIDRVVVSGTGLSRESAIEYTAEVAVTLVMERYARTASLNENRERIRNRILDQSAGYLQSLKIIDEVLVADGVHEVTAEAAVDVGKLVTSLKNLHVAIKLIHPGPNQAFEGRRGTTGPEGSPDHH